MKTIKKFKGRRRLARLRGSVIGALLAITKSAWNMADDAEEDACYVIGPTGRRGVMVDMEHYRALCAGLDRLDRLPDPTGEAATGPRKAQYWLSQNEKALPQGGAKKGNDEH